MAGIFPNSGVAASTAINTLPDGAVDLAPGCTPLWHSTSRCQPRFDPAAANAMMSEFLNLFACFQREYDCNSNANLCALFCGLFSNLFSKATVFNQSGDPLQVIPDDPVLATIVGGIYADGSTFNGGIDADVLPGGLIRINEPGVYRMTSFARIGLTINGASMPSETTVDMRIMDQNDLVRYSTRQLQTHVVNPNGRFELAYTQPFVPVQVTGLANNIFRMELTVSTVPDAAHNAADLTVVQHFIEKIAIKDFNCDV